MKKSGWKRTVLMAATFGCASLASAPLLTFSSSSAMASEATKVLRRPSCAIVRYYVALYSATTAEAWARSKGATEAEIQKARFCLASASGTMQ